MPKISYRQYRSCKSELEARLARLERERDSLIARHEAHLPVELDGLNVLHDHIADVESDLHDLEFRWDTRNWGAHEWTQHDLITSNID